MSSQPETSVKEETKEEVFDEYSYMVSNQTVDVKPGFKQECKTEVDESLISQDFVSSNEDVKEGLKEEDVGQSSNGGSSAKCDVENIQSDGREKTDENGCTERPDNQQVHSFQCSSCEKTFPKMKHLRAHQIIHSGVKPCQCSVCERSCTHMKNLRVHETITSGVKPFQCTVCGKSFSQMCSHMAHQRTHSGERPFQCTDCGKIFNQTYALTEHQRIHSGEKPLPCCECGKCFRHMSSLKNHKRRHLVGRSVPKRRSSYMEGHQ